MRRNNLWILSTFLFICFLSPNISFGGDLPGGHGKIAFVLFFPESTAAAGDENWTTARMNTVGYRVWDVVNWWVYQADTHWPAVSLTMGNRRYAYWQCTVNHEPIAEPHSNDLNWISNLMSHLGYGSIWAGPLTEAVNCADAAAQGAGWSYGMPFFIAADWGTGHMGAWIYGKRNDRTCTASYDCAGWGIDDLDHVLAHETGHGFGATDEYTNNVASCSQTAYGWTNKNGAGCVTKPCGGVQCQCIMAQNVGTTSLTNQANVCYWTRGQIDFNPTAVDVIDVVASNRKNSISVVWEKPLKRTVIGWQIFRRAENDEDLFKLTFSVIPENQTEFVDRSVLKGATYAYVIKEINADGAVFLHHSDPITHKKIVN